MNEAYAVTSGLGYLSVKAPSDPISDPYLSIMGLLIVPMAPFLVITMVAVHAHAAAEHKSYSLAALAFSGGRSGSFAPTAHQGRTSEPVSVGGLLSAARLTEEMTAT